MAGETRNPMLRRAVLADAAVAFAGVPGIEVIDEGDLIRSFAPGRQQPYVNAIARLDLGVDADAGAVAARIHAVEAAYRRAGLPTLWWLDDDTRPTGVAAPLAALGLRDAGGEAVMAIAIGSETPTWPADPTDVAVRVVTAIEDLDAWIAVTAAAYGWSDPARAELMRGLYDPRLPHGRDERRIQVLGLVDGVPVSAASLFRAAGQGWITNVGTIPAARGRGAGGAVTVACLRLAAERGDPTAWLAASAMGEPVYTRLGFQTVGRLEHLLGPAPTR
jgi:ribosomal protein S18 acetylase RimI-like enzyme